ncbi:MAG: hemerythrin domain-containing protein [Bryobacteraceae bacterium]|nr:hemerythrin domain-containing protein [Bryobacteraceae bacterium]
MGKATWSTLAIGVAAGVAASRLLPPVIAQFSGKARARAGADPFDLLIQDHRKILAILSEMERLPMGNQSKRGKLFLALKRTLAKHAMAEEDAVYPLLHGEVRDVAESRHLYDEHADMKIFLYELEQAVMNNTDWSARVEQLRSLIQRHVQQEEQVEFPKLRQALSERKSQELSGQIRREEALVL